MLAQSFAAALFQIDLTASAQRLSIRHYDVSDGLAHSLYQSIDVDENVEAPKSINVMLDSKPPAITATGPATIFNDVRVIHVTISGKITDNLSGVDPATANFAVQHEYGRVQPSGPLNVLADGSYSFNVALRTFVRLNDTDGRLYTIRVSAADNAGNRHTTETSVTVRRLRVPPCKANCI